MQYIEIENIKNSYTVGSETIEVLAGISFAGGQVEFVVVTGHFFCGRTRRVCRGYGDFRLRKIYVAA